MELTLGFGTTEMPVRIPDRNLLAVLTPNPVSPGLAGEAEVRRALEAPIGAPRLRQVVRPGETVAIITSDITRPCPTAKILLPVLEELYAAGIRREDITLVFALGSHRRHTEAEQRKLAGAAFDEIRCVDGDPDDCVHLGVTAHGTPVDVTRVVAEADRRICLGNIEYHYFAGYSGGAKAIMPGVSTRAAIQSNHSMMVQPEACAGNLRTTPCGTTWKRPPPSAVWTTSSMWYWMSTRRSSAPWPATWWRPTGRAAGSWTPSTARRSPNGRIW